MDEGGRSVPSVSLGKSKGPKTKGQSVCVGPGAQEKLRLSGKVEISDW